MTLLIFMIMIFCHLIADFNMQGWLAEGKQRKNWKSYNDLFQHDYACALVCHGLIWSFMIMLPIIILDWKYSWYLEIAIVIWWLTMAVIHAIIDHLKANLMCINLWQDQLFHLGQIALTWGLFASLTI